MALFDPVDEQDDVFRSLVETAVFAHIGPAAAYCYAVGKSALTLGQMATIPMFQGDEPGGR